jgi:hypothetical protein
MLMMGLLFVAAADNADAEEEKEPVADKESARTGRQYITHADPLFLGRNPSHLLDYSKQDESVVQYDPSGLGFEIQKTGVFQYQFRPGYHSEPARPAAEPIKPPANVQPKTANYRLLTRKASLCTLQPRTAETSLFTQTGCYSS